MTTATISPTFLDWLFSDEPAEAAPVLSATPELDKLIARATPINDHTRKAETAYTVGLSSKLRSEMAALGIEPYRDNYDWSEGGHLYRLTFGTTRITLLVY